MMVIGPAYSARRSCSAVRDAANPPPTMTMPPLVVTWAFLHDRRGEMCATPMSGRALDDVGQHDDALAAFDVGTRSDAFQRLFEVPHVAGEHVQDGIGRSGHGGSADD